MSVSQIDYDCSDSELDAEGRALGTMLKHPEMAEPVMQYLNKQMFSVPFYRAVWSLMDANHEAGGVVEVEQFPEVLEQHEDFENFGGVNCIRDLMSTASPETFIADTLTLAFRMDRLAADLQALNQPESRH